MINGILMDSAPILAALALAAAAIAAASWYIYSKRILLKKMSRVIEKPELAEQLIRKAHSPGYLLARSALFEAFARKNGPEIIRLSGIDDLWVQRLLEKKKKKDFIRVLQYSGEKGLFKCFLASMQKKRLAGILMIWLEKTGEYLYMRKLAAGGKGEDFDGSVALDVFRNKLPEIREMTGDPEWASRYFAVKILLHDKNEEKSARALWDGFKDSHPLIRKSVALEFNPQDKDRLFGELYNLVLKDAVLEVRKASFDRIHKDFPKRYKPVFEKLTNGEVYHVLELLRDGHTEDESLAMHYLENANLELRFIAAGYLDRNGLLYRLCDGASLGDGKDYERRYGLLKNACEVNVSSFLSIIEKTASPGSLLICARLLLEKGDRSLIPALVGKAITLLDQDSAQLELYETALDCVSRRGNDESFKLFDRELRKRAHDDALIGKLLSYVPERGGDMLAATLLILLKDKEFKEEAPLIKALERMPVAPLLPDIFEIIQGGRGKYAHAVRIRALKLLGALKMEYCVQSILENLPLLQPEEAKDFARVLSGYNKKTLIEKIEGLLGSSDAKLRAALIASIPITGEKSLIKEIVKSLKDADPDVRIASVWALVDIDDEKLLDEALSMLRDPVERVRTQAAQVLGTHGSDAIIKELKKTLLDENEAASVKRGAALGLGYSRSIISVDVLIAGLEAEEELKGDIILALARKTEKKLITRIIELFKDSLPELRQRIKEAFKSMNEKGEKALEDLLREEIPSLKPYIAEIFESTGFIEDKIRALSHRDPLVRKEAAGVLSLVGTKSAFRGIVLAARDPDEDVRVMVTKALERLGTKEGTEILDFLENDPDRRVRKYTHWALERLKAKSL